MAAPMRLAAAAALLLATAAAIATPPPSAPLSVPFSPVAPARAAPPPLVSFPTAGAVPPSPGIATSTGALIRFDGTTLEAYSLTDNATRLWASAVPNCAGRASFGHVVCSESGVVVASCRTHLAAFDAATGQPLWTYRAPLAYLANIVPPSSLAAGHRRPGRRAGIVLVVHTSGTQASRVQGLNAASGAVVWSTTVSCHLGVAPQRRVTGVADPGQRGVSSHVYPDSILQCTTYNQPASYAVVSPATGNYTFVGYFAATLRRDTVVSIGYGYGFATVVEPSTAAELFTAPLVPPPNISPVGVPGISAVVFDTSRNTEMLLAVVPDADVVQAYVVHRETKQFYLVWVASVATLAAAAGFPLETAASLFQMTGFAQPEHEERRGSVVGVLHPEGSSPQVDVLFRLSLATGAVETVANFTDTFPLVGAFLTFVLSDVPPPPWGGRAAPQYMMQRHNYAALLDAESLRAVYVNQAFTFNYRTGFGAVIPHALHGANRSIFISEATNVRTQEAGVWVWPTRQLGAPGI